MASYTPNYNLKKPAGTDVVDIADLNGNMDIVDTQLASLNSNLASLIKTSSLTLSEAVTVKSQDFHSTLYSDYSPAIPSDAKIIGGFISTYNTQNATGLFINKSLWYSTSYINVVNAYKNDCTLLQGNKIYVYYI